MTSTKLIYNGWLKKGNPLLYNTTDSKGNKVVQKKFFLDPKDHEFYNPQYDGICNVCGEKVSGGIPTKKIFGSTYLDWGIHKGLEIGTHVCSACAFAFLLNTKVGRNTLYRYSVVANFDETHICNRLEMRDWLINPPEPPFTMSIAVSQKKHIVTKSKVSYNREKYFCNLEEITYEVDRSKITYLIKQAELLRGIGVNKTELETFKLNSGQFTKLGIEVCTKILKLLNEFSKEQLWKLAVFVAGINENEEEIKCFLDLEQKTK